MTIPRSIKCYAILAALSLNLTGCGGEKTDRDAQSSPTIAVSTPESLQERSEFTFDASGSASKNGAGLTFLWSVEGPGTTLSTNGATATVSIGDITKDTTVRVQVEARDPAGNVSTWHRDYDVQNTQFAINTSAPAIQGAEITIASEGASLVAVTDKAGAAWFNTKSINTEGEYVVTLSGGSLVEYDHQQQNHATHSAWLRGAQLAASDTTLSVLSAALWQSTKTLKGKMENQEFQLLNNTTAAKLLRRTSSDKHAYATLLSKEVFEYAEDNVLTAIGETAIGDTTYATLGEAYAIEDRDLAARVMLNAIAPFIEFNQRDAAFATSTYIELAIMGKGRVFAASPYTLSRSSSDPDFTNLTSFVLARQAEPDIRLEATPETGYILADWDGCDALDGSACIVKAGKEHHVAAYFIQPTLEWKAEVHDISNTSASYSNDTIEITFKPEAVDEKNAWADVSIGDAIAGQLPNGDAIFVKVEEVIGVDPNTDTFRYVVSKSTPSSFIQNGTLYFNKTLTNHDIFTASKQSNPTMNATYSAGLVVKFDDEIGVRLSSDPQSETLEFIAYSEERDDCDGDCSGIGFEAFNQSFKLEGEYTFTPYKRTEVKAKIEATGSVRLALAVGGHADVSLGSINSASVWFSFRNTEKVGAKIEGTGHVVTGGNVAEVIQQLQGVPAQAYALPSIHRTIASIPVYPPIVYIQPGVGLNIGASLKAGGATELGIEAGHDNFVKTGLYYTKGAGTAPFLHTGGDGASGDFKAAIKAEVKAEASAEVFVDISVSGARIPLGAFAKATVDGSISAAPPSKNEPCSNLPLLSSDLKGELGVRTLFSEYLSRNQTIDLGFVEIDGSNIVDLKLASEFMSINLYKQRTSWDLSEAKEGCEIVSFAFSDTQVVNEFRDDANISSKPIAGVDSNHAFSITNTSGLAGSYSLNFADPKQLFKVSLFKRNGPAYNAIAMQPGGKVTIAPGELHAIKVVFDERRYRDAEGAGEANLSIQVKPEDLPVFGVASQTKGTTFTAKAVVVDFTPPPAPTGLSVSNQTHLNPTLYWHYPDELKTKYRSSNLMFNIYINGQLHKEVKPKPVGYSRESAQISLPEYGKNTVSIQPVTRHKKGSPSDLNIVTTSASTGWYYGTWSWDCQFDWAYMVPARGQAPMSIYFERHAYGYSARYYIDGVDSGGSSNVYSNPANDGQADYMYLNGVTGVYARFDHRTGKIYGSTRSGVNCSIYAGGVAGSFSLSK